MDRKQLVRDVKRAALTRMEEAARTVEDFNDVVKQWDHLDENRERKERFHEMGRDEKTLEVGYTDGQIFPLPYIHPAWRQAIKGEFLEIIFDSADEMWQVVEDWDVAAQLKALTDKQKDVIFLSVVRLCTPQQIACHQDKTDRAVRKLMDAAMDYMHRNLAPIIREQIKAGAPDMTLEKRQFLKWYDKNRAALDNSKNA